MLMTLWQWLSFLVRLQQEKHAFLRAFAAVAAAIGFAQGGGGGLVLLGVVLLLRLF